MATATEMLSKGVARTAKAFDPFMNAIKRGTFPVNAGTTVTTFQVANIEPTTDIPPFQEISLTNGDLIQNNTNLCDNTYAQVDVGFIARTYSPRTYGLKGPLICRRNLTYNFDPKAFFARYQAQLAEYATRTWSNAFRENYMFFSQKFVNGQLAGNESTAVSAIGIMPTMKLTYGMLEQVADELNAQSAYRGVDASGFVTYDANGPMYTLMIEPADANILLTNSGSDRRQDFRSEITGGKTELSFAKRLAAARTWGSFRYMQVQHMPRYNVVNGALVRIPTFINANVTEGVKSIVNPAYKTATIHTAIVLHPDVMEAQIVPPTMDAGGGVKFEADSYAGDWKFIVGGERLGLDCADPMHDFGQHYANFVYAPKPVLPEFGKVIFYKACNPGAPLLYADSPITLTADNSESTD